MYIILLYFPNTLKLVVAKLYKKKRKETIKSNKST